MLNTFPFFRQRDQMDCGPTCLQMIARFHGRSYSLPFLQDLATSAEKVCPYLGIEETAERIGFALCPSKYLLKI